MAKRPAFQFYPADWLNDIKLQSCSLEARGLLIDLMCVMHQSEKYGYLLINGHIPLDKEVAHLLRLHHKTYDKRLIELISKGVLSKDENGLIYSKRMIKDEYIRNVRSEAGKLGGNPLLKQEDKQELKQKSTPSTSSSVSSSTSSSKEGSNEPKKSVLCNITFSFEERKFIGITATDLQLWNEAYPAVDINIETKRAVEWLLSNPTKRKKNYRRFLINWFARTQEKGGTKHGPGSHQRTYDPVDKAINDAEERLRGNRD